MEVRALGVFVLVCGTCHHRPVSTATSSLIAIFRLIWPVYCLRCGIIRELTSRRESNSPHALFVSNLCPLISLCALGTPGSAAFLTPQPHLNTSSQGWGGFFLNASGSTEAPAFCKNPSPHSCCLAEKWGTLGLVKWQVKVPATDPDNLS